MIFDMHPLKIYGRLILDIKRTFIRNTNKLSTTVIANLHVDCDD